MALTKSVKNAAIHKKIFEFKPGRFTRVLTGVAAHWQCYQDQPNQPLGGYLLQPTKMSMPSPSARPHSKPLFRGTVEMSRKPSLTRFISRPTMSLDCVLLSV